MQIPYLRINSEDVINISITNEFPENIMIELVNNKYSLRNVKSVYFRRAPTVFPNCQNHDDTIFINHERRDFLEGLYLTLECKWVNPIYATYKAEKKLYQLTTAQELGFMIPQTIVSNNPIHIRDFISKNGECIIKPICHGLQITANGIYSIYTSSLTELEWLTNDLLLESPVLIQRKVENYRDIRATVVGEKIFAVEIQTDELSNIDWRKPNIAKRYKKHALPEAIQALVYKLNNKLGLIYSAFDFILTPSGDYCF